MMWVYTNGLTQSFVFDLRSLEVYETVRGRALGSSPVGGKHKHCSPKLKPPNALGELKKTTHCDGRERPGVKHHNAV